MIRASVKKSTRMIWHKRFAFFPRRIGPYRVWLEPYAWRLVSVRMIAFMVFRETMDYSHPILGEYTKETTFGPHMLWPVVKWSEAPHRDEGKVVNLR